MPKLPILMYHSVTTSSNESVGLTIDVKKFEEHLQYLKSKNYRALHFKDLEQIKSAKEFPEKAVIITFDDVYVNQLELAVPLLEKYGFKASFYIPFKYVGKTNTWDEGKKTIMSVAQLKSLNPEVIELGLHSFSHGNYKDMPLDKIRTDFEQSKTFIKNNDLNLSSVLAYPYGKYPKKGDAKNSFFECLDENNIAYGLRIGNRVNKFPFKNNYEIQRIDIKGEDSLSKFKLKLRYGKLKLF